MILRLFSILLNTISSGIIIGSLIFALSLFTTIEGFSEFFDYTAFMKTIFSSTSNTIHIESTSASHFFFSIGQFASNIVVYVIILIGVIVDFIKKKFKWNITFKKKFIFIISILFVIYSILAYFIDTFIYLFLALSIVPIIVALTIDKVANIVMEISETKNIQK